MFKCSSTYTLHLIVLLSYALKDIKCVKIAVVGGGMSGLVVTKYAKELGLNVTTFEQTNDTGGTWVYYEQTGKDKNGLSIPSARYKNLIVNTPNPLMEFQDFKLMNRSQSSYSTGQEIYEFLKRYAQHFDLNKNIKFEHLVNLVQLHNSNQWRVVVTNLATDEVMEEVYDAVFICNGQYFDPKYPEIPGLEHFHGEAIHSHDYRRPEAYTGKDVMVVGFYSCGTDIVLDLSSTAKRVLFSHFGNIHFPGYNENVQQKPAALEILPNGNVHFKDGSVEEVDAIIFCTGYNYKFPFLTPESNITVDGKHIKHLYKHVVNIHHPTMFFIGIVGNTINTLTIELQAQFSLHWLLHPEKRLSRDQMRRDTQKDLQNSYVKSMEHMHKLELDDIQKYFDALTDFSEVPQMKPVYAKLFKAKQMRLMAEPVSFRQYHYEIISDEEFSEELRSSGGTIHFSQRIFFIITGLMLSIIKLT